MPTYHRSRIVRAGEERVFEYLADVGNLPKYFDRMTGAEPAAGDRVRVTAEVDGQTERGEGWFRADRTARRIQWGSTGPDDYHGTVDLQADQNRTIVDIELHTEHTATDEIDRALDITLDHIAEQVEASR